jgi:hypothetical protein
MNPTALRRRDQSVSVLGSHTRSGLEGDAQVPPGVMRDLYGRFAPMKSNDVAMQSTLRAKHPDRPAFKSPVAHKFNHLDGVW